MKDLAGVQLRAVVLFRTALLSFSFLLAFVATVVADHPRQSEAPSTIRPSPHRLSIPGLPNLGVVDTGIFRCGRPTAGGYDALRRLGVRTIINLERYPDDGEALRRAGIVSIHIPLSVMRRPTDAEAARFLAALTDTSLRPILVHCQRGIDRTGAMVGLYRVRVQGWTPARVLEEMEEYGYEQEMFPRMAEFVLEQVPGGPARR